MTPVLADVNLVGIHVLPEVVAGGGIQVGLDVVAALEDVVALRPAKAFPSFGHRLSPSSESLEIIEKHISDVKKVKEKVGNLSF